MRTPQALLNVRARSAAVVRQTAGRARLFADRTDILASMGGSDEISEGVEEYREQQEQREQQEYREVQNALADLVGQQTIEDLSCL